MKNLELNEMESVSGGKKVSWKWSLGCAFTLVGSAVSIGAIGAATFGVGAAVALSLVSSAIALSCTDAE